MLKNKDGRIILLNMVKAIQDNKQYLGDIDGLIGDGDHGMNMNKGFSIFKEELKDGEVNLSDGLLDLGTVLLNKIGGSMGPIYGTMFMDMSDAIDGKEEVTLKNLLEMLNAGLEGLYSIVDARPGDKTLIDTYYAALKSVEESIAQNKDFKDALDDMKQAAENGKDSTKDLVAKYGRAARLGERSKGVLDAGASSCCLILNAMADGMKEVMA